MTAEEKEKEGSLQFDNMVVISLKFVVVMLSLFILTQVLLIISMFNSDVLNKTPEDKDKTRQVYFFNSLFGLMTGILFGKGCQRKNRQQEIDFILLAHSGCGAFVFTLLFFFEFVEAERLGYSSNFIVQAICVVILLHSLTFIVIDLSRSQSPNRDSKERSEMHFVALFLSGLVISAACFMV
mmetsp:Transcript_42087/g.64527  ORF Transcript_42087/g.64527 Transcript_42087/m.64527 type:complete len:182 (+) Transcript_42087:2864-3409(+)